jgi:hypothetical protein
MNQRLAYSLRLLWALALLASLGVLAADLPGYFDKRIMATMATGPTWLAIGLYLSATLVSLTLACLLVWKKANDTMALFLANFLLLYGIILSGPLEFFAAYWFPHTSPYLGEHIIGVLFPAPALVLILIFPNGQFVPRWSICLPLLTVVFSLLELMLDPEEAVKLNTLRAQIITGALWLLSFFAMGIQAYRYRMRYTPVERQQTKWVVYGSALWVALGFLSIIPYNYLLNQPAAAPARWWAWLSGATWVLFLNILPLSLTLAILRSRLWDIDIIIRRTLVYTALTAILGLIYLGSVVLLQQLVRPLMGSSELVIVASTLAIAALFNPLRRRIQNAIDRRFYRRKYDAAKVLAAFAATARDETDLERLTDAMLRVADDTMQPEFVGLWLRDSQARSTIEADRPDSRPLR